MAKKISARKEAKGIMNKINTDVDAYKFFVPAAKEKILGNEDWNKKRTKKVNNILHRKTKKYIVPTKRDNTKLV